MTGAGGAAAKMASSLLSETAQRVFTPETLRSAAKQSQGVLVIPLRLRRAIKKYLRERPNSHMRRNVLQLSQSLDSVKRANLLLSSTASRELVEDPAKPAELQSRRWKIQSGYGDIGLKYGDDETVAYVASRMPAVFSACHRVLREVRRRLPDFAPTRVLDFGSGPATAMWAVRHVWPHSLEQLNLVEPSQDMQRAGQGLLNGSKSLPHIKSYDSLQSLNKNISKLERKHDLVISSYALGEIPSVNDRITVVRQLWDLTKDVLILIEPGTPHGFSIISQMRSHILWMAKRKCRKIKIQSIDSKTESIAPSSCGLPNVGDKLVIENGAYVVAPCPHDGRCPLENTTKYCHFVQRLERTSVQRAYKRSKGASLRGFEDEKFCFVALRRGTRPQNAWPLDGLKLQSLKEQKQAKLDMRNHVVDQSSDAEDGIIDQNNEKQLKLETAESIFDEDNLVPFASDVSDVDTDVDLEEQREDSEVDRADLGGGWGRIIHSPVRRGRLVEMNVCRCTRRDCSEGAYERVVLTRTANPDLHRQAKKSLWGDLWPCGTQAE